MKKIFSLFAAVIMAVSVMGADPIVLTFKDYPSTSGDGSTLFTTTSLIDSLQNASGFVTCSATSKAYPGRIGYGCKLGSSSATGSFTLTLVEAAPFDSIVVYASSYSTSEGTMKINKGDAIDLTDGGTSNKVLRRVKYVPVGNVSTLEIATTSKRAFVKSITFYPATPSEDPEIKANDVNLASDATSGVITYSLNNMTAEFVTNAEVTSENTDWISNVTISNSAKEVTFNVSVNEEAEATTEERSGIITLTCGEVTKEVTITQAGKVFVRDYAILPFSLAAGTGKADLATISGVTQVGIDADYADENYKLKFNSTGDYLQVKTNERIGQVTFSLKALGGSTSTGKFALQESTDGSEFTEVEVFDLVGAKNAVLNFTSSEPFAADSRYVRFVFKEKDNNVGMGAVSIAKYVAPKTYTVNFSNSWASFCAAENVALPEVVVAYKGAVNEDVLTLTPVDGNVIPANVGVMLKSTEASATLTVSKGEAADFAGNELLGTTEVTAAPANAYCYSKSQKTFAPVDEGFSIPANKAYLKLASAAPERISIVEADHNFVTELVNVESKAEVKKMVVNGKMMILRDGKTFDVMGRIVK